MDLNHSWQRQKAEDGDKLKQEKVVQDVEHLAQGVEEEQEAEAVTLLHPSRVQDGQPLIALGLPWRQGRAACDTQVVNTGVTPTSTKWLYEGGGRPTVLGTLSLWVSWRCSMRLNIRHWKLT